MKCGLAANTSATKITEANKNIDTDDKIRNFICFMTVILAVIKTKAVCFNFYFNKDCKQSKQIIARAGRKISCQKTESAVAGNQRTSIIYLYCISCVGNENEV